MLTSQSIHPPHRERVQVSLQAEECGGATMLTFRAGCDDSWWETSIFLPVSQLERVKAAAARFNLFALEPENESAPTVRAKPEAA